jgi:predicted RNase H-like HicB family nuclease
MKKTTVEEYMELPYTVELIPDEGSYLAKIKELDGCMTVGDDPTEALEMLNDAKEEWFYAAIEDGFEIPLPESMREVKQSGKFALRMPKSLHHKLTEGAEAEGVSLNQYIVTLLAERNALMSCKRMLIAEET